MTERHQCTKHGYKSKPAAQAKLRQLRARRRRQHAHKTEQRAYQCELCSKWHLTSQSLLHGVGDGLEFR